MQLRVARLCLDCEELFVGDTCPICASQRFAFLSNWLPVEERRRWRRPAPRPSSGDAGFLQTAKRLFARWTGGDVPEPANRTLRTRASDHLPKLNFEGAETDPAKEPRCPPELARDQTSTR
jgi:hypothetical protein